ncbi:Protein Y71H2B.2 [Aphelenchoides avenae]|nr:Protein Y71H2B.2 [Aphelenchus avenae]
MDRLRRRETESDAESTGSLEEGELLDDRELSTATPTSDQPISGRTNANLWKEVVLDQNLEQITSGARVEGNLFDRGSESYAVPVDEDFEEVDRVKQEELKTTKRKAAVEDDDLFGASSGIATVEEFGVNPEFRKKQRTIPSDAIRPSPSEKAKAPPQSNAVLDKRKRRFKGSSDSLNSMHKKRFRSAPIPQPKQLPVPKELVTSDFSLDKLLKANFPQTSNEEELGRLMSDALGEKFPEILILVAQRIGKELSVALFNETKRVEKSGGMLIRNRSRRRTPGGVFLNLFRRNPHISKEIKDEVFAVSNRLWKEAEAKQESKMEACRFRRWPNFFNSVV